MVNLFLQTGCSLPKLVHMSFWALKRESLQSSAFPLPLNGSHVFPCTASCKLFIIAAVFPNCLGTRSNIMRSTVASESRSFRDAALFYLLPLLPAPNVPRPLPSAVIFFSEGRWGN